MRHGREVKSMPAVEPMFWTGPNRTAQNRFSIRKIIERGKNEWSAHEESLAAGSAGAGLSVKSNEFIRRVPSKHTGRGVVRLYCPDGNAY